MSQQIDPRILQKLAAFAQRRRRLIIFRGVCAALATLLATMMLIALIDWLLVLPDGVRWALSGAAYLAIFIVEWRSCLRLLVRAPDARALARLVEHAEPKLREDLLSAVELGDAKSDAAFDSEQFRALVQTSVAARVAGLDMERLLPARLVRRYLGVAAVIVAACLVAFALTGFQFGTLMMRALLPMANLARISSVQVKIIEPHPAEMKVAQGDTLPLVIETSGRRATKAMLEIFTKTGGRELVQMDSAGDNRFSATIQVGRENVLYRVRAGDAMTRKYQLEAAARPAVEQFEKVYNYPSYSRLGVKRVTEENGDLAALEGTEVELRLRANQKVSEAELKIEQGQKNSVVPLVPDGDFLVGKIPLTTSGVYRVRLVGADTGFENKFSPEYELRAEHDLVPQVDLALPKEDLVLPANEIVDVQGTATDDLALAKVLQLIKTNDGAWKETELAREPGPKAKIDRRWDLFEQGAKPGDVLTLKLAATDLKGNRGESRSVQITITARGFEFKRVQALEPLRQLWQALEADENAAVAFVKQTEPRNQLAPRLENEASRQQLIVAMTAALEEFAHKNQDVAAALDGALRAAEAGHQTADLVLMARAAARANAGGTQSARSLVDMVAADPTAPFAPELLREAAELGVRAEQRVRSLGTAGRVFLTSEEIDVLAENFQVIAREQMRLDELARRSANDVEKWAQLAKRLRVILAEARSLEEVASVSIEHASDGAGERLRKLGKDTNDLRTFMESALAAKAPGPELLGPTLWMTAASAQLVQKALELRRDFQAAPERKLNELLTETQPSFQVIEKMRQNAPPAHRNSLTADVSAALQAAAWDSGLQMLQAHGDAEERRIDADSYFVSDVRFTTLVLQTLEDQRAQLAAPELAQRIAAVDCDFRLLESGHNIAEILEGLNGLARAEQWEIDTPQARTTNPRDWSWLSQRLAALPAEMDKAMTAPDQRARSQQAQQLLREALQQPATQRLALEMSQRFDGNRAPLSEKAEVEQLATVVQQVLDLLRQPMSDARQELAQMAPKFGEMAARLAKKTDAIKQATAAQVKNHDEEKSAQLQKTLAAQQMLNKEIAVLQDALRADANQQDILKEEGRERARDADDALAMLKEPPVRAEEDLAGSVESEQAPAQEQALQQATEQQQKLQDALQQIARHYDNVDKGRASESRVALRATEEANGGKAELDRQFAQAAELGQMAQTPPRELLARLEKALPKNPLMQNELSAISKNALAGAEQKLRQASAQENAIARQMGKMSAEEAAKNSPPKNASTEPKAADSPATQNSPVSAAGKTPSNGPAAHPETAPSAKADASAPQNGPNASSALAQDAQQQRPIGAAAQQAGSEIARAARHEQRLQNKAAGEQLQALGDEVQATAEQQVPAAGQALEKAQRAEQAREPVNNADAALQKNLEQLTAADEEAAGAISPPGEPANQPSAESPREQIAMARALDALDAALNSSETAVNTASTTQGGPPPTGESSAPAAASGLPDGVASPAQAAISAATQAVAAEMREARSGAGALVAGDLASHEPQAASTTGVKGGAPDAWRGALAEAKNMDGDWGKLPKQVAEQLSQGQQEAIAGEYRNQVETYYRVIAEKSKKP